MMVQPLRPLEQVGARREGIHRGGRQQQYFLDESGRRLILALYDGTTEKTDELMERLHVPRWRVKRWAIDLGLVPPQKKQPDWTEQDELYLEAHIGRQSFARIAQTLGRTKTAVQVKAKRIGVNQLSSGYTMRGLCMALGCNHHKAERWLKNGWLEGTRRESDRPSGIDFWLFTDQHIRDFVIAHPLEIDPRRIDWVWMVSLLSGGSRVVLQESSRPQRERGDAMYIDVEYALNFDIDQIAGKNIAVLGITRSGKTNTAMVLTQELLSNSVPCTIVDIDGEYRGLKERFPLLIAGRTNSDIKLSIEEAAGLAKDSIEHESSILLDLSDYSEEECHDLLFNYFTTVWELTTKRKSAYQIVLEEAHEFIPEGVRTPLKNALTRIALRGRKRGLGLMLVSQRSAKVSKDALSQCDMLFLHKVIHPADRSVYKSLVPLSGVEVDRMISDLTTGHAIIVSEQPPAVAQIRASGSKPVQPDIKAVLRKRVKELEEQISEQEETIRQQADLIARCEATHPEIMAAMMQEVLS